MVLLKLGTRTPRIPGARTPVPTAFTRTLVTPPPAGLNVTYARKTSGSHVPGRGVTDGPPKSTLKVNPSGRRTLAQVVFSWLKRFAFRLDVRLPCESLTLNLPLLVSTRPTTM